MQIFNQGLKSARFDFNASHGQSSLRGYILKRVEISAQLLFQPCTLIQIWKSPYMFALI